MTVIFIAVNLIAAVCFLSIMYAHIRRQDFLAAPYEATIARLSAENAALNARIASHEKESNRLVGAVASWRENSLYWEKETFRLREMLHSTAARKIADLITGTYVVDLN